MINFGGMLMAPSLARSSNGNCAGYPTPSTPDLTTLSATATENSRRFSVTSLLELEDLQVARKVEHDTDKSEGKN